MEGLELRELIWPIVTLVVFFIGIKNPAVGAALSALVRVIRPNDSPTLTPDSDVGDRVKFYLGLAKTLAEKTPNKADDVAVEVLDKLSSLVGPLLSRPK
jgi:hypothetical protein